MAIQFSIFNFTCANFVDQNSNSVHFFLLLHCFNEKKAESNGARIQFTLKVSHVITSVVVFVICTLLMSFNVILSTKNHEYWICVQKTFRKMNLGIRASLF